MQDLIHIYRRALFAKSDQKLNCENLIFEKARKHSIEPIIIQNSHNQKNSELSKYTARHLLLVHEFQTISDYLKDKEIEVLFFKGIVLGVLLYENPVLRPSVDIDILVAKEDKKKILDIFRNLGYYPKQNFSKKQFEIEIFSQPSIEFYHPERKILVDIHWEIGRRKYGQYIDSKDLFSRARNIEIYNRKIKTLSIENTFVVLVLNASRDIWQKLQFVGDMYFFVNTYPKINLNKVIEILEKNNLSTVFFVSVGVVRKILDSKFLVDIKLNQFANEIVDEVYLKIINEGNISDFFEFKIEQKIREGFLDKLKNICARIFLPHDSDFNQRIPDRFYLLYFILKPLKTISRAVKVCFF